MDEIKLKPCPFCGRIPMVEDCGDNRYFVRCKCGIAQDKLYGQRCDAVRRWNTRKPSAQPEIIYCKDCVKHNKGHGYYYDGTVIGIKDCCPLVEIRGRAQGHEFDYQFCAYAERRTDEMQ